MENIHFSTQNLIGILCFTICLIYLLQILLTNLIPPKSNKYFGLHLGVLLSILALLLIKHFYADSLFNLFLPLLIATFLSVGLLMFYIARQVIVFNEQEKKKKPIVRSLVVGETGFIMFLVTWVCSLIHPQVQNQLLSLIDLVLVVSLFALLPIQSMYYSYNSIKLYKASQKSPYKFVEDYEKIVLNWIRILIFGYLGLTLAVLLSVALEKMLFKGLPYASVLLYLGVVGIYIFIQKRQMTYAGEMAEKEGVQDPEQVLLNVKMEAQIVLRDRLITLMEEEMLYLNKAITIQDIAGRLQTNTKYLSQATNNLLNQSIVTFVNSYRIRHAKNLLGNPENNHFTLETIGEMSGFNSKSSFNAVFKRFEGVTPSQYKSGIQEKSIS